MTFYDFKKHHDFHDFYEFSSPLYVLKLKVYLGEIVRTFTGKEWQIDD